jgi:hypothetical protein
MFELVLLAIAAVVALGAVALRNASAALVGGRMGALWTLFVAAPYTVASRFHYEDAQGRNVSVIPNTLRLTATDVAAAKLIIPAIGAAETKFVVPPGPPGAIGIRFEDYKQSADGTDTKAVSLLLGPLGQDTGFQIVGANAANAAVSAQDRTQGLDKMLFGIGQTLQFTQTA